MSFKKFLSQRFSLAIAVGLFFASLVILWQVVASPATTTIGENISVGGKLGIGTPNPTQKLHIYGDSGSQRIRIENSGTSSNDQASLQLVAGGKSWISWVSGDSDQLRFFSSTLNGNVVTLTSAGNVGIGTTSPSEKLHVNGNVLAYAYLHLSDPKLKTHITPLNNSLTKILQLSGVSFVWKDNGQHSIGLLADEVEKIFPEIVFSHKSTGLKSIDYSLLVVPLIEAIKTQQNQIEALQKEIENLEFQVEYLKRKIK
jgi:hypothetical protein